MPIDPPPGTTDDESPKVEPEPLMDRRMEPDRRVATRRERGKGVSNERRSGEDRRKGGRRASDRAPRNINQYDVSEEELEFINAVIRFRERTGNRFPKARDILQILKDLGYEKRSEA